MTTEGTSAPVAPASLDLSSLRQLDSVTIDMMVPGTSKPSGWRIELAGPAHPQTVALGDESAREVIDEERAIKTAQVNGRKWKSETQSPNDRRRRNVGLIVGRIIGWSPDPVFSFVSPQPVTFSRANATELFMRPDMGIWFVQLLDYINSETAFMPPSEPI